MDFTNTDAAYLQAQGEQLQRQVSHEHELPHWQAAAVLMEVSLRFFRWFLRFDFMVIDLQLLAARSGILARIHRPFIPANERTKNPLQSFLIVGSH